MTYQSVNPHGGKLLKKFTDANLATWASKSS